MILPIISKIRAEGREAIDPHCIDYDDIMTCVNERDRFSELNSVLSIIDNLDGSDLDDFGCKYLICTNNINDAYLAAIAIYNAISMKIDRLSSCIFFDGSKDEQKAAINMALLINPAEFFEQQSRVNENDICMIFLHDSENELQPTANFLLNDRLEFHIVRYEDNIPKLNRLPGSFHRICINANDFSPAESYLENYFYSKDFEYDNVKKEMQELIKKLKKCDEYTMISAAKQIISNHLSHDPFFRSLEPVDFENVCLTAKRIFGKKEHHLVGLANEREKLNNIIKSLYFEKLRSEMGYKASRDGCHIVFAGPPGTAKTTLAREFAARLAEIGLIKDKDAFIECVKSDYIGQYVGQTAAKVDAMFRSLSAKGGGVIFFDEIYTIAEDDATVYDKEAVTCILQNMENYRQNVFCIFAGYEDKMSGFIKSNPGLRSRISDTIRFKGYDDETLGMIFYSMLNSQDLKISGNCEQILKDHFTKLRNVRGDHFGNGREVRNLIVNAKQQHVKNLSLDKKPSRKLLTSIDPSDISKASEDILASELAEEAKCMTIGF